MTPRAATFAILLAACRDPVRSAAPTASPEPVVPAAPDPPPPPPPAPAEPRPASAVSAAPATRCDVDLPRRMEFVECYSKPRTLGFPDCRTYVVERAEGDESCEPGRLTLGVTGFQSISDDLRVTVRWDAGRMVARSGRHG